MWGYRVLTSRGLIGPGSIVNEVILYTHQKFRTGASPQDTLFCYTKETRSGREGLTSQQRIQSAYAKPLRQKSESKYSSEKLFETNTSPILVAFYPGFESLTCQATLKS